uniref:Envelope glycoprotein n=1 Tax=Marmota marmota marmota TaxID=9994 RepID=A0A8C6A7E6_MARMA
MEVTTHPESAKDKTHLHSLLIFLALCFVFPISVARHQLYNPNQPVSQTWQVLSGAGDIIWEKTSAEYPLWAWWPTLGPDLCHLLAGADDFDIPTTDPAKPARAALRKKSFYVCPRDMRTRSQARKCGQHENYYCKSWGCETTGDAWWKPSSSWDLIQVKREKEHGPPLSTDYCKSKPGTVKTLWYGEGPCTAFTCNPLNITFTQAGKVSKDWIKGKLWGLRVYHQTAYDPGVLFKIRLIVNTNPQPVGPNKVLWDQQIATNLTLSGSGKRLIDLVEGGYQALNSTQPNLTESCWICLQASPPYYEGVAINGSFTYDAPTRLCAALKENCCFYTDHTGVVRESMTKLRERLDARKKSLRGSQSWFESWFNKSPWLTTIVSTVAGPLIVLLLILTFGPCIFNRLMQFIKERLSVIQTMVLTQQYQLLQQHAEPSAETMLESEHMGQWI